ncbi:folate family ECF transporter S component [Mycoplasmopsis ciconiae]|uniref:Folate family ECF transporter S component n=1 Tax=Mycoplasmopsis ciconiae TaxID=561067 RepID=A0ABU7ML24_9BACT|nr:folate family ECF transporter S component [Mycoplasmopsis ciconiae]
MKRRAPILPTSSAFSIFGKWSIRKMVFVAILISISVVFTIVSTSIFPPATIPTMKFSFIGLPVKITGFIFGPVIGFFVGLVSDLISMLYIPPSAYNPLYTLATSLNGLISGIVGWIFLSFLKFYFGGDFRIQTYQVKIIKYFKKYHKAIEQSKIDKADKYVVKIIYYRNMIDKINKFGTINQLLNINTLACLSILLSIIVVLATIFIVLPETFFIKSPIKNKYIVLAMMALGYGMMSVFVVFARFKLSPNRFLVIVPIIVFSAILEFVNVPILSLADNKSIGTGNIKDTIIWIITHIVMSPVKVWFNLLVIYYSYSVIASLIYKNSNLTY